MLTDMADSSRPIEPWQTESTAWDWFWGHIESSMRWTIDAYEQVSDWHCAMAGTGAGPARWKCCLGNSNRLAMVHCMHSYFLPANRNRLES